MDLTRFPVDKASFDGPVLVTGAGGCIGSWALALLTNAGVPAVAFDLSDDRRRPRLLMTEEQLAGIPWVTGDIADTEAVADAVARHHIRAIIHLAALQVPFCKADPVAGAKANVVGTVNVFEAARRHGLQRARVCQLDRGAQLPAGRALARHPVRRLQAVRRDDRAHLRRGLGRAERRHPPRRGLRRRARSGADLEDHRGDPRRRGGATLYRAVLGRRLGAARGRDRLGVHQGGVQGARRCAGIRSERPGDLGRRVARPSSARSRPARSSRSQAIPCPSRRICRTSRCASISATTGRCRSRTESRRLTPRSGGCSPSGALSAEAVA